MNKKKGLTLIIVLFVIIFFCILACKYYLFTDDTVRFHSYLNQADGIRVWVFKNGEEIINTEIINAEDELYTKICDIFQNARLRPSLKSALKKMLTGNTFMEVSADTDLIISITLFQNSQALHGIFLGGNNEMHFDKEVFCVGDFSNASELQIMNEIFFLFQD